MRLTADQPWPARPEKCIDQWEKYRRVIDLRAQGKSLSEIGRELGVPAETAREIVGRAADWARDSLRARTDELFAVHDARLERLYNKVQSYIDSFEAFNPDMFRVALAVLAQQATLFGLNKNDKGGGNKKRNDWIQNATPTELIHAAEQAGLSVPAAWKKSYTIEDAQRAAEEKARAEAGQADDR